LLLSLPAQPGCASGQCGPQYEWRAIADTEQFGLLHNGRQVGCWHTVDGYYRALHPDGSWGPRETQPPVSPPPANFGLVEEQLTGAERYGVRGRGVPRREAVTLIGAGAIPDHGSKLRLTVIGPAAEREAVLRDIASHADLARWKDRLIVAGYEPGHWHVAR